jgi:hypothetical protein
MAAIETGLAAFVKGKLGLADEAVLWANQNAPVPRAAVQTWVSISRGDLSPLSPTDGVVTYATDGSPSGHEVTLTSAGVRTLPVSLQAFSRAGVTGNASAFAVLSKLQTQMRLPSSEGALLALGLGLMSVGPVRTLDALVDQAFQGRSILELQFNLVDSESETTTFIERVSGTVQGTDLDEPFDTAA